MGNTLNRDLGPSRSMQAAAGASLPMGALDIGPAGHGLRQLFSGNGESVGFVVKDDVWWPLGRAADAMHGNTSFMLAVLAFHCGFCTGDAPELPATATPGPWWIEGAEGNGHAAIGEPHVAIMAMSPIGKEALAYVRGRARAELIVDAANRSVPDDPCF